MKKNTTVAIVVVVVVVVAAAVGVTVGVVVSKKAGCPDACTSLLCGTECVDAPGCKGTRCEDANALCIDDACVAAPAPAPPPPPSQSDACPSNSACVQDVCSSDPFAGNWRLLGGANKDIQVIDGDQIFQFEEISAAVYGDITMRQFKSTAIAYDATPSVELQYTDHVDESGNRVITMFATARIYVSNYEDFEVGDSQRTRFNTLSGGGVNISAEASIDHYLLSISPPGSDACVQIDSIDFDALCATGTSPNACMFADMPLFLERVE